MVELVDQPFVLTAIGSGTRAVIQEKLDNTGITLQKAIEFGNTETVKKAVEAGIGISILSEAAIRNEVAAGRLRAVPLDDGGFTRTFYIMTIIPKRSIIEETIYFKPAEINCDGCLSSKGRLIGFCNTCEVRQCAIAKSVENCSTCDEQPCDKLNKFHEFSPDAKASFEALLKKNR